MARRGDGNYQFSLIELSVLAMGVLATVSAVFLMGFYVGRDAASEHAPLDERVARIPISDNAAPEKPAAPRPLPPAAAPPAAGSPPPAAPPAQAPPTPQAGVPYTVQALATRNKAEAEDLRAQLVRRNIGAFISAVEEAGTRWYRVRIGRYDDLAAARAMESRVRREMGLTQASIVPAATETR